MGPGLIKYYPSPKYTFDEWPVFHLFNLLGRVHGYTHRKSRIFVDFIKAIKNFFVCVFYYNEINITQMFYTRPSC